MALALSLLIRTQDGGSLWWFVCNHKVEVHTLWQWRGTQLIHDTTTTCVYMNSHGCMGLTTCNYKYKTCILITCTCLEVQSCSPSLSFLEFAVSRGATNWRQRSCNKLCVKGNLMKCPTFHSMLPFSLHGMKVRSVNLQLPFAYMYMAWITSMSCSKDWSLLTWNQQRILLQQ